MINLIQPITVQQAYKGITPPGGEHHEIGGEGRLMMTMATDSTPPSERTPDQPSPDEGQEVAVAPCRKTR